jgi:2-methylisocitrate lyase-like PEP mutase family enzyme
MPDQAALSRARERAEVLRRLHTEPGLLVLVNVWDVASARAVAAVPGCQAVATASAAIAAAHGYPDGERIPVDLMLAAVGRIAAAVDLPTTADLESGYGGVDTTIRRAVQLGVAGANLEDALRPLPSAIRMVEQAVDAAAAEGVPLVLNARTDRYLQPQGQLPAALLEDALQRGQAFLDAGADCVFVPGCTNPEAIATLVDRFGPGRLSLLAVPGLLPPEQLRRLGVARLSHGPAPHRHALAALTDLAAGLQATTIHT